MSDDVRALVYASWGLFVAECPRPGCLGAEHFGHAPISGHVGGLTRTGFRCARCGLLCAADWPANAADVWAVLSQRPLMENRSWNRQHGETLEDLIAENVLHGLVSVPAALEGGTLLAANGRLVDPALVIAPVSRHAIGAS